MTEHDASAAARLAAQRRRHHPHCCVCGASHDAALAPAFRPDGQGGVIVEVDCPVRWEGYPGMVHGGVSAALLDGAMTNCLFARGVAAVTADMRLRYRRPLELGKPAVVTARIVQAQPPLYQLVAEVIQQDQVCAVAEARFLEVDAAAALRRGADARSALAQGS